LNDSGAVGVHEWCEIRLILPQGRLDLCEQSGRIWHSWWAFWLLFNSKLILFFGLVELTFAHTKSDKKLFTKLVVTTTAIVPTLAVPTLFLYFAAITINTWHQAFLQF
jgi:hypothetical protein